MITIKNNTAKNNDGKVITCIETGDKWITYQDTWCNGNNSITKSINAKLSDNSVICSKCASKITQHLQINC